ncbi:MAG TPA: phospho-N-acetylmuramoyl-pentapeptide-transferase, partial [Gemmatimonadaceae bacterium]|nr:phospho-N-acetylmuramoyl-pentapeptide-transferase [Gemmatimonadaceae bacterium]
MLTWLMAELQDQWSVLRLFNFITFRAAGAAVSAILVAFMVGPFVIRRLRAMRISQVVREGTPDTHAGKSATPTMGGIIILIAAIVPTLLWMRLNSIYVWVALFTMAYMGAIGFWDDYLKLKQQREGKVNVGLVERHKLLGQVSLGVILGVFLWQV